MIISVFISIIYDYADNQPKHGRKGCFVNNSDGNPRWKEQVYSQATYCKQLATNSIGRVNIPDEFAPTTGFPGNISIHFERCRFISPKT
jgi:hypothetical protein